MYGFVATLAKVVLSRIRTGDFEWLTIVCIVALLTGTAIGAYFVQTAYASGPPDLVIAGLTVIDPIVAIVIGLAVLREADGAPLGVRRLRRRRRAGRDRRLPAGSPPPAGHQRQPGDSDHPRQHRRGVSRVSAPDGCRREGVAGAARARSGRPAPR
jgi:hypothetical protein